MFGTRGVFFELAHSLSEFHRFAAMNSPETTGSKGCVPTVRPRPLPSFSDMKKMRLREVEKINDMVPVRLSIFCNGRCP